ncbi:MAG TPA: Arm DNA-binding domain-containing protein, partial [Puia sp.]|nr:Arm DNA-binding domain-containing protein [Puia sp.]
MELLNIRFNFLCRATHTNGDGYWQIVMRVIYRSERKDIWTGLYCDKDNWDAASQKVFNPENDTSSLNKNLDLILRK